MDWIPVINSVPKEGAFVLVSVDKMYVDVAFYRLGRFVIDTKQIYPDAWMPLPPAYRMGKHEYGRREYTERMQRLHKYGIIK